MFIIIWQYQIKEGNKKEFEAIYSENGVWAKLFKKAKGYVGTELLQDETNRQVYLTIDRWESKEEFETFQSQWQTEYKLLDAQCEGFTEKEFLLGRWNLK